MGYVLTRDWAFKSSSELGGKRLRLEKLEFPKANETSSSNHEILRCMRTRIMMLSERDYHMPARVPAPLLSPRHVRRFYCHSHSTTSAA